MNYAVSEFKYIQPSPRILRHLEEQRHMLLDVRHEDGQCIARFSNGDFAFPAELRERLSDLVGKRIACLRFENRYLLRDLEAEDHDRS
jgi:hypothetical protein